MSEIKKQSTVLLFSISIAWFPLGIHFTNFIRAYEFLIFFLPEEHLYLS